MMLIKNRLMIFMRTKKKDIKKNIVMTVKVAMIPKQAELIFGKISIQQR
jgi:hypothetical protein